MMTKHARILARTLGVLAAVAVAAGAPMLASAEGHGGGGGGGGGHAGGGGGGHFSGGGGAHFSGGGARFAGGGVRGFAGGAPRAFVGGTAHANFSARPGGVASVRYAAAGNHVYGGYAGGGHVVAHSNFVSPNRPYYGRPGWGGSGRFWGGGYYGGRFWPGVHYGPGFAWFLPVLPFGYATYYWGGLPYYYYDNAYYQWDPSYNGYVATDPPPVAQQSSGSDEPSDAPPPATDDSATYVPQPSAADSVPNTNMAPPPSNPAPPPSNPAPRGDWGGASNIFVYPRNGQSEQQTANDKFECHKWSVAQTGFDPTRSVNLQGTVMDYRRAIDACLDARGYTVK